MTVQWKSFGIGVMTTLAVIAIFAWPYREEIDWAIKNRKTLGKASDIVSAVKGILS